MWEQRIRRVPPAYLVFWLFFDIFGVFWKITFAFVFSTFSSTSTSVTFAALASHGLELLLYLFFDITCSNWAFFDLMSGRVALVTRLDNWFFRGFRSF